MTFEAERKKLGRRPIVIVEADLDACANTYGVAPCTAEVGETGSQKCFNCFKTCQDPENFAKTTKTYRFCSNTDARPIGETMFPCVTGVDKAPTQLDPKGLSVNSSVTVNLSDFPHHDRGIDPYVSERPEPTQGTFFGKLRARNPYIVNRKLRVLEGYVDDARQLHTKTRTYFFDRMEGPDAGGNVRFIGKGLLKFTDDDKAQIPAQSRGKVKTAITNTGLSLTLEPAGIGAEYTNSGKLRIDDEIITYSSRSGDTFTISARGTDRTVAAAHSVDAAVQQCVRYSAATVPDVLYDMLVDYAKVDPAFIDKAEWDDEATTWLGTFLIDTVLTEPTGVKEMMKELLQSCGAAVWWDEVAAQVRFKVMVPFQTTGTIMSVNETRNILANSVSVRDLEKERISRVVIHFDCTNFLSKPEKATCLQTQVSIDTIEEGEEAYGVPVTLEFATRWITSQTVAEEVAARLLTRYAQTPREVTFSLDAKDSDLRVGDLLDMETRQVQSIYGKPDNLRYIVTEDRDLEPGSHFQFKALQITQTRGSQAYLLTDADQVDWTLASDDEKFRYFFLSDENGLMSDGSSGAVLV